MAKSPAHYQRMGRAFTRLNQQLEQVAADLGAADLPVDEAFPTGPTGRVSQVNGLYRSNWFNGRFLTAEAFRADQVYTDTRARMVAQIHPPGIAWGLTLKVLDPVAPIGLPGREGRPSSDQPNDLPGRGGTPSSHQPNDLPGRQPPEDAELARLCKLLEEGDLDRLQELLAERNMTLDQLREQCGQAPAEPTGMPLGTRVTLAPGLAFDDLGRPISVGADHTFTFTDLVQRYRTRPTVVIGGGTTFAPCTCVQTIPPGAVPPGAALPEGPYLMVITPVEVPEGEARRAASPCAGRPDDDTCDAEGWRGGFEVSLSRLRIQVPVQDWQSPWDLRGLISGWYFDVYEHDLRSRWNRTGAGQPFYPRDPALWQGPGPHARVESAVPIALVYLGPEGTVLFLDSWIPRRPIASTGPQAWSDNVRGAPTPAARVARIHQFQAMLNESLDGVPHALDGPNLYDRGFRHIPPWGVLPVREPPAPEPGTFALMAEAEAIRQAREDAKAYFAGTNVIVTSHVAIHDDDLLEDVLRADPKDPIVLQRREPSRRHLEAFLCWIRQSDAGKGSTVQWMLYGLLAAVLEGWGDLTLDQLVNREVELVRLVIPMDPRRRELAVVGSGSDDPLAGLFEGWSEARAPRADPFADLACMPRRYVVYVKQRLVLLEAVYLVLDLVLDLLQILVRLYPEQLEACASGRVEAGLGQAVLLPRAERRSEAVVMPWEEVMAATEPIRASSGATARVLLADPGVRSAVVSGLSRTFPELRLSGTWQAWDAAKEQVGRDAALVAFAEEHRGFGVLKGASLVLPEDVVDDLVAGVAERAVPGATLAGATFHKAGYVRKGEAAALAGAVKDAYRQKVGNVLDAPVDSTPAGVREEVSRDAEILLASVPKLAKSRVLDDTKFFEDLREARAAADGDLEAGLDKLAKTSGTRAAASELKRVTRILGPEAAEVLLERLERLASR